MDEFGIVVTEVVQETPVDRTLRLAVAADEVGAFNFVPGQYLCVWDPAVEDGPKRYFSLSGGDPETGQAQVTIRRSPDAEPPFYATPVGTALRTQAPAGTFTLAYEPDDQLILLGAGSGITPFRAYVEALIREDDPPPTTLVQSDRDPTQLVFHDELSAWDTTHGWFRYFPVITGETQDWAGHAGRVDGAVLAELIDRPEHAIVCACGPAAFVDAVLEASRELGVPEQRLRREGW